MALKFAMISIVMINVALTFILFLFQASLAHVAIDVGGNSSAIDFDTSAIDAFNKGGAGNYVLDSDVASAIQALPTENDATVAENSNIFTDTIKAMKNWLLESTGIKYVLDFLNAVPNAISKIFPKEMQVIGFAIGWLWHVLTVVTVIFWFKG